MRLQSRSATPQALFEDIARQLFSHLIDPGQVGAALREKIAVEGESLEHLLHEWVVALLDLVRVQRMVFSAFKVSGLETPGKGPYVLQAEAVGELLDVQRHALAAETTALDCREVHLFKEGAVYRAEIDLGPAANQPGQLN
jgi:SHS2 domain-containing protein